MEKVSKSYAFACNSSVPSFSTLFFPMKLLLALLISLTTVLSSLAQSTHATATPAVRHEVRAAWLTTLFGLDWPQRPTMTTAGMAQQRRDLLRQLDELQAAGINTVLFQARIRATTAYPSALEPWDAAFTGQAGHAPDYDPLQLVVDECHRRGMECHAWVVAFPICKVTTAKQLGKRALPQQHPELCQRCGDQWMMDPGVPETAKYLARVCREIVEHYEVDGIHLDYIRYPEKAIPFKDDRTYRLYGHGRNKALWRRENVDRCVRAIHDAVKSVRPWVKLSCSPVGKYADLSRYSSFGWNARDAVSQNAQEWLQKGWMDMLFPMMYFDGNHFYPFLADWQENAHGRPIVPGLGIYFLHPQEKNWSLLAIQRQMNVCRQQGLGGQAFFRTRFLLDDVKGLYHWLQTDFYREPALLPPMTWADSIAPASPDVKGRFQGMRLQLQWEAINDVTPISYNVYRLDSIYGDRLLASRLRDTHYEQLLYLPALKHSRYAVTAVDAYGNESQSTVVLVKEEERK